MIKKEICVFKIMGSSMLIGIIVCILVLLPPEKTQTITKTEMSENNTEKIITEEIKRPYWQLFLEWCAAGSAIGILWIWRNELKIKGVLGVEGPDPKINQQTPDEQLVSENVEKIKKDSPELKEKSYSEEWYKQDRKKKLNEFLSNYQEHGFFNVNLISKYFGYPTRVTEDLLFEYVSNGILRVDANPEPIFSLQNSYENQTIDFVSYYISKNEVITKEIRFATIDRIEYDALFETEKSIFLVDVKLVMTNINMTSLMNRIRRSTECALKFKKPNKNLVIAIGCKDDKLYERAVIFSKSYKYDDNDVKLTILPVKLNVKL